MPIILDAPPKEFPFPDLDPRARNGMSFWHTFRPRHGVDNAPRDLIETLITKLEGCLFHVLVKEKQGLESHLHWVTFEETRIYDVSNYIKSYGQGICSPLHFIYEVPPVKKGTEWYNYKHNCVRQTYNMDVVTEYLSGQFETKEDDPFELLSANMPADLNTLVPWMTDLSTLGKQKAVVNAWALEYEKLFKADHPGFQAPRDQISEAYLTQWWNIGVNVQRRFQMITTAKTFKDNLKALHRFINMYSGPGYGSFDSACRLETPVFGQLNSSINPSDGNKPEFQDEDRDHYWDNMTQTERNEHEKLCSGIS